MCKEVVVVDLEEEMITEDEVDPVEEEIIEVVEEDHNNLYLFKLHNNINNPTTTNA